jgi:glycine/D-amino acid oxidase-like deaminating enzyme
LLLQVTPRDFTVKLLEAASSKQLHGEPAVEVIIDTAEGIVRSSSGITGVRTKQHGVIATEQVIICLGPWSGEKLFVFARTPLPACFVPVPENPLSSFSSPQAWRWKTGSGSICP